MIFRFGAQVETSLMARPGKRRGGRGEPVLSSTLVRPWRAKHWNLSGTRQNLIRLGEDATWQRVSFQSESLKWKTIERGRKGGADELITRLRRNDAEFRENDGLRNDSREVEVCFSAVRRREGTTFLPRGRE